MLDEGNDMNLESPAAPPPEESNNRTFLIVGGIFAGLIFLTLVCFGLYFFVFRPGALASKNSAQATIEASNAQVIQQMTSTAEAAQWTPTLPPTDTPLPSDTPAPLDTPEISSPTPVVAISTATLTETATTDPATLAAMQTQLSNQMTSTAAIAMGTRAIGGQGMPTTGFFDQVALPTMIILAVALVAVIFVARRLRKSPTK
ncbi:MAG TPA: hypothetical protein VMC09_18585 [Anaerolineales bacterium]|nr:hypothetical protein [Anaerolineales bacterium]